MGNLPPQSRIYFLAICGTGMSALAGLLKQRGHIIAGSDVAAYPPVGDLLKNLGIPVHLDYDVEDLKQFQPNYVVVGNFVRRDNPQAQYVLESKIPYGSFPSTLESFFLETTQNLVVVGTHGKTTTTSCLAYLLKAGKADPSFLIGGVPLNFEKSFHFSDGKYFVIEGDEYDTAFFDKESKFLHYKPNMGIFTSMEWDHADIFPTVESMEKMFRKFVHLIPEHSGALLYSSDWPRIIELVAEEKPKCEKVTFGFNSYSNHVIQDFMENEKGLAFTLDGTRFTSEMTGKFNAQNFAGAVLAARRCGIADSEIQKGLRDFRGVKRRQEVRAIIGQSLVIDDFAHHPTAVQRVLQGLRSKYPKHKIVCFFEPRSNTSRRNILQKDFESAFVDADEIFIADVFRSEALAEEQRLDLQSIAEAHRALGKNILAPASESEMISRALELAKKNPCAFVLLSNGSFNGLHDKLISALKVQ